MSSWARRLTGIRVRRRILVSALAMIAGLAGAAVAGTAQASNPPLPGPCNDSNVQCYDTYVIWAAGLSGHDKKFVADVEYASLTDRANVHLWSYLGNQNQKWVKARVANHEGVAWINQNSGKCLDMSMDQGGVRGAQIYQYTCSWGENQFWYGAQQTNSYGYVSINNGYDIGECMDLKDFNYGYGAAIQSWSCSGGWNQMWSFERLPA